MKTPLKLIFAISFIFVAVLSSKAQTPADVVKHGTDVTFFGIDFSSSKGVVLGATAEEMRDKYFPAINTLLVVEKDKYSIKKALSKSDVTYSLDEVNKSNQALEVASFNVYSAKDIKALDIDALSQMVQRYNLQDKKGIGLVFIAESLDKTENLGVYHLVYFSMPEGKIILTEKVSGKPKGFGMRNFWANSIYEILQSDIQKNMEKKYLPKKSK
jgi:hypothetical protein